ncbi:MAG: hypothetical protein A2W73_02195 [Deltaproteobacteria bacterium RIFCSPLOWO2_12_55_13]|nr:MAG: hypothetical protein A2W73_02195 [Deltaproteobacteria bacterium RIFCSPLOWO2_12_55_13]
MDHTIIQFYLIQTCNILDVDETLILDQPFLHDQEQFGPASINPGGLPVPGQKVGRVFHALRFF